ncbi:MAG TPA: sugar transporter [Bacteroidales bacterium]|nr:sugar transporter [Bacteroidales bacterium]
MKNKLLITLVVVSMVFASCNRRSQLLYMQNIDETLDVPFATPPSYKLGSGDILYIQLVTHSPEISMAFNNPTGIQFMSQGRDESSLYLNGYTVNPDGFVQLPFLGEAQVKGLTLDEARSIIQQKTNALYKDASVIVKLASFRVTIVGEVRRPGVIRNFNDNLNIFEAIAAVGDITENGDRRKVLVVRPTNEGNKTYRLNLADKSVLASGAFYLQPNDVIVVEPIGNKVFQMNVPYITLTFTSISTLILLYNFITKL